MADFVTGHPSQTRDGYPSPLEKASRAYVDNTVGQAEERMKRYTDTHVPETTLDTMVELEVVAGVATVPLGRSHLNVTAETVFEFPEDPEVGDHVYLLLTADVNEINAITMPAKFTWPYTPATSVGSVNGAASLLVDAVWVGTHWMNTSVSIFGSVEPPDPISATPVVTAVSSNGIIITTAELPDDQTVKVAVTLSDTGVQQYLDTGVAYWTDLNGPQFEDGEAYTFLCKYVDTVGSGRADGPSVPVSVTYEVPTEAPTSPGDIQFLDASGASNEITMHAAMIVPEGEAYTGVEFDLRVNDVPVLPDPENGFYMYYTYNNGTKQVQLQFSPPFPMSNGDEMKVNARFVSPAGKGPYGNNTITYLSYAD